MVALVQVFARLNQYAAHRNGSGYTAEEKPCSEDDQQQGDGNDKDTLPRRGNCQQSIQLFAFFLCFGNSIVKGVK